MEEIYIVLGVIIIITIFIVYKSNRIDRPCDEYITYFDKMYYDLPKLNTLSKNDVCHQESMYDMDTFKQQLRAVSNVGDSSNPMASRWSSLLDLHNKTQNGSIEYTNTDRQVMPADLQHQITQDSNKVIKQTGSRHSKPENFADDEWLDDSFSMNKKYSFGR